LNHGEPSLEHWINLLSVSTKYELDSIRPIAIKGIDVHGPDIDPVEKYALAVKYAVKEWEASSFKILCQRPDPLTVEDAIRLGVITVTKVFREREKIRSKQGTREGQTTRSPQPVAEPVNRPRDPTAGSDPEFGPSKVSQPNATSTTSTATTTTKPVASSTTVTATPPNDTTVRPAPPKVKIELSEEKGVSPNPQPSPSQPINGRPTAVGSLFAPAPPLFPPPVSGKTPHVSSIRQSGDSSADAFLGFTDFPKKPLPSSGLTPATSQGQGFPFSNGATTSNSLFGVKIAETQKTPRESTLPVSASESKFAFKQ
jgi:hypothetical protein